MMATKSFEADVSSGSSSSEQMGQRSDGGITLKTSASKLFTVANLRSQFI